MLSAAATVGAVSYMLGLGAWRSRNRADLAAVLPLPINSMYWQLTNQHGQAVQPADWIGRPVMVFFGFTWCPDVCPTTLSDISLWLDEVGFEADRMVIALITVDPDRDQPQVLGDYLMSFDPRIVGLTGPADQIARAASDFRVTYSRVPQDDGDYTMDHSAGVFLFHPDGSFASIIDFHEDRRFAVPKLQRILN